MAYCNIASLRILLHQSNDPKMRTFLYGLHVIGGVLAVLGLVGLYAHQSEKI